MLEHIHKRLLVGSFVSFCLALILACGSGSPSQTTTASSPAADTQTSPASSPAGAASPDASPVLAASTDAAPTKQSYAVGETAELNGIKVTLNEVKQVEGNQVFKPEAGKRFIVINATFENTTDKEVPISTLAQMELKDETGQAYTIDIGATSSVDGKQPDGMIAPGDKVRGPVGYHVPTDAKGLQWIFKEAFGSKRVVFDITL
jgi:hypothetical protein